MNLKLVAMLIVLSAVLSSNTNALTILPLYGDDSSPWGTYGGDVAYGEVSWSASNGIANFTIELDPTFTIFGFSFNTNVTSNDFLIEITNGTGWSYRGLNTLEGIGTDRFDYSLWRSVPGSSNILNFSILGSSITQDTDFFRPNLHPTNPVDWDAILHQSHFGAYASNNSSGTHYILSDSFYNSTDVISTIPEPSTFILLSSVLMAFAVSRKVFSIIKLMA